MKRNLKRIENSLYHFSGGKRKAGANPRLRGDCSGLWGYCTGLRGDLDECGITREEREKGVRISDLVEPQK